MKLKELRKVVVCERQFKLVLPYNEELTEPLKLKKYLELLEWEVVKVDFDEIQELFLVWVRPWEEKLKERERYEEGEKELCR